MAVRWLTPLQKLHHRLHRMDEPVVIRKQLGNMSVDYLAPWEASAEDRPYPHVTVVPPGESDTSPSVHYLGRINGV